MLSPGCSSILMLCVWMVLMAFVAVLRVLVWVRFRCGVDVYGSFMLVGRVLEG